MTPRLGLALTGGGARGAYQAGVLRAIAEIAAGSRFGKTLPFSLLSGVSAGSISAAFLACHAGDFRDAAGKLASFWGGLQASDVFRTDGLTLTRTGVAWLTDLGLGGWLGVGRGKSLLDTAPLRGLLRKKLELGNLRGMISAGGGEGGRVEGLAVTATSYRSGTAVTFFDGVPGIDPWLRSTRMGVRTELGVDHIMASTAIPALFPAVPIEGTFYGDGCVRMTTPLSPVIHMGADKVLAIGVRSERSPERVAELNRGGESQDYPRLAEVAGVLLNAMFLDSLEGDVERMTRINGTLALIPEAKRDSVPSGLRIVPVLVIKPSRDLGGLVAEVTRDLPATLRHFLKGLGVSGNTGWDFLSYLAFDTAYTSKLVELGYADGMAARAQVQEFLEL